MPVASLPDQSLGIPDLEGLLQYQFSLGVDVSVKSCRRERGERKKVKQREPQSAGIIKVLLEISSPARNSKRKASFHKKTESDGLVRVRE